MYPFYLELEMVKPVIDFFKKQDFKVNREIRIGFHIADIVCFRDDNVVAVELKLKDWKKAIIQAKNYQLGADYVYLCFPLLKTHSILRKCELKLRNNGIGLLAVNEKTCEVSKIIEARRSDKKFGTLKYKKNTKNNRFYR